MMFFVITYDVPEEYDSLRTKLAKLLKNYGFSKLQKSVFVGRASYNMVENLTVEIKDLFKDVHEAGLDVRIFPLCKKCLRHVITVIDEGLEGSTWLKEEKAIVVV